ncbi:carboxylesterase 5A isoform X2 [Diachasmimorpha longicaudata]|uniref:carboxylesterase 5A isoform X2 n=1 Tax=Diachasmimorpha longicaudata TaxID=58733 RepID=UPI0030B8C373
MFSIKPETTLLIVDGCSRRFVASLEHSLLRRYLGVLGGNLGEGNRHAVSNNLEEVSGNAGVTQAVLQTAEGSWNCGHCNLSPKRSKMYQNLNVGFQVFIVVIIAGVTSSQRTVARQGSGKDPPVVKIPDQGSILGREIPLARPQKVTIYLGIPYAQPPVGELRFRPPVTDPPVSWSDTRNATQFAPSCQQTNKFLKHEKLFRQLLPSDFEEPEVSEDCLYLNLYVPDGLPPEDGWPVMVWFHGGDFNTGTPAIWDATTLVNKQKILVVTVAYRLNIFGFFTTGDAEAPGNYGMLDQVAALDWIKTNIELFEGSPRNIVISGHNAGAISVGLHITSPLSKGKFAKAIAMSGDAITSVRTADQELPVVEQVADRFACVHKPTALLMECLRRIAAKDLLDGTSQIETWGPIIDGDTHNSSDPFLPLHPRDILDSGNFNSVPLMAGYTSNEQSLAYMEISDNPDDGGITSLSKFENTINDEIIASIQKPDNTSTCESKPQLAADAVLFFYRPYPPTKDPAVFRARYLDMQTEKNYAAGLTYLASKVSKDMSAFVYRFDYRSRTSKVIQDVPLWAGVPHMFELPFIWGLPHVFPTSSSTNINWSTSDKNLADVVMMLVGNFIRSGSPSLLNVRWEAFTEETPGILVINRTISINPNEIDYRALAFWNDYYPFVVEEAMNQCCNATGANGASGIHRTQVGVYTAFGVVAFSVMKILG